MTVFRINKGTRRFDFICNMSLLSDATLNWDGSNNLEMLKVRQFQEKIQGIPLDRIVQTPLYSVQNAETVIIDKN